MGIFFELNQQSLSKNKANLAQIKERGGFIDIDSFVIESFWRKKSRLIK